MELEINLKNTQKSRKFRWRINFITQINRILGQVLVDNTGRQIDRIDLNLDINSSPTLIEF